MATAARQGSWGALHTNAILQGDGARRKGERGLCVYDTIVGRLGVLESRTSCICRLVVRPS